MSSGRRLTEDGQDRLLEDGTVRWLEGADPAAPWCDTLIVARPAPVPVLVGGRPAAE